MELQTVQQERQNNSLAGTPSNLPEPRHFIEANTLEISLRELSQDHIIPVFIKDNEPVISHVDFIETTKSVVHEIFPSELVLDPVIRVSHPIKGRVPEAKNKAAVELLEHEKTIYYERMAFIIEIPSIYDEIEGSKLSLTVGGVKAYNMDNLYNKKGADESFKIFIGFKNQVCTNLCVWSDGLCSDLKVHTIGQLKASILTVLENYNASFHLHSLCQLKEYSISEKEFAQIIGKCRMYQHLPYNLKKDIPKLSFGDNQIGLVCKDYYRDQSFSKETDGSINLWKLYNLFTGSNKSSYIENFLDKSSNAFHFIDAIRLAKASHQFNWFLNQD